MKVGTAKLETHKIPLLEEWDRRYFCFILTLQLDKNELAYI